MSTIAAISTAPGNAGIGIIRLSGDDCFKILQKIFKPKNKGEIKGYLKCLERQSSDKKLKQAK